MNTTIISAIRQWRMWIIVLSLPACVFGQPGNDPQRNVLLDIISGADTTDASVYALIREMEQNFPRRYGLIASDSIKVVMSRSRKLQAQKSFLLTVPVQPYKADKTDFTGWLQKVFAGATSTADSIDHLCRWIPENFAYGDPNFEYDKLETDSFYRGIRDGNFVGDCGTYTAFLCRLAYDFREVWGWGTAISLSGVANSTIPGAGKQPSHDWVGFVKPTGEVWCVADPTVGGVVRDKQIGGCLSLDTIINWLRNAALSGRVYVKPVQYTIQATGPVVFTQALRTTTGLSAYKPLGSVSCLIRGEWYTYLERGSMGASMVAEYWYAEGFSENKLYNIYALVSSGVIYSSDLNLRNLMAGRYKWTVNLR